LSIIKTKFYKSHFFASFLGGFMVTIKKRKLKKFVYFLIIIAIIYAGYNYVGGARYPDIDTPKPVFGNEDSSVTVVEFADIQCPACKAAHPTIQRIKKEYENDIQFQFYHFPLRNIHPYAQKAAEAIECANDQGAFFEYVDAAFAMSPNLQKKNLKIIAGRLELDQESFDSCLDSGAKSKVVEGDYRFGAVSNVRGTPTFLVNNEPVVSWDYGSFKAQIDRALGR
jgi:protein-disulfide isomerase